MDKSILEASVCFDYFALKHDRNPHATIQRQCAALSDELIRKYEERVVEEFTKEDVLRLCKEIEDLKP